MKYKSKFKMALLKQEKEIKEKEVEIAAVVAQRMQIVQKINKEEEKDNLFRAQFQKGGVTNAAFFAGAVDNEYINDLKSKLAKIDIDLKLKRLEYERIMKKKQTVVEMDKRDEKLFSEEVRKKEQKKLIGMQIILKTKENRGE